MPTLPGLTWFSSRTVGELAHWIVANFPKPLKHPNESWTRPEIRSVVRAVITEQIGLKNFKGDDDFIKDMRID